MKQILLILAVVALVGCGKKEQSNVGESAPTAKAKKGNGTEAKLSPPPKTKSKSKEKVEPHAYSEGLDPKRINPQGTKREYAEILEADKSFNQQIEIAVRLHLKRPKGELSEKDWNMVEALDLSWLPMTFIDFNELARLRNLNGLDLNFTETTDTYLKQVVRMKNLTHLGLAATKITNAGLEEVAKLENLKNLFLYNTQVSKSGVAKLQKALPKCKIYSNPKK